MKIAYVSTYLPQQCGIVHIQHEYGIYKLDDRLPTLIKRLKKERKRTFITIHCITPLQFAKGELLLMAENCVKEIAELADEVIVHLESQKAILERLGIHSEKIHIIPQGTELSNENKKKSRLRLNLPEEGKIMTVFGFINPFKDLDVSLEVLKEVKEEVEDVYLFIAGGLPPGA